MRAGSTKEGGRELTERENSNEGQHLDRTDSFLPPRFLGFSTLSLREVLYWYKKGKLDAHVLLVPDFNLFLAPLHELVGKYTRGVGRDASLGFVEVALRIEYERASLSTAVLQTDNVKKREQTYDMGRIAAFPP